MGEIEESGQGRSPLSDLRLQGSMVNWEMIWNIRVWPMDTYTFGHKHSIMYGDDPNLGYVINSWPRPGDLREEETITVGSLICSTPVSPQATYMCAVGWEESWSQHNTSREPVGLGLPSFNHHEQEFMLKLQIEGTGKWTSWRIGGNHLEGNWTQTWKANARNCFQIWNSVKSFILKGA